MLAMRDVREKLSPWSYHSKSSRPWQRDLGGPTSQRWHCIPGAWDDRRTLQRDGEQDAILYRSVYILAIISDRSLHGAIHRSLSDNECSAGTGSPNFQPDIQRAVP